MRVEGSGVQTDWVIVGLGEMFALEQQEQKIV